MIAGSDGLGLIHFNNANMAQLIGILALIIILFEGGLQTKWSTVKSVTKPALSLATLGVILTTVVVAVSCKINFRSIVARRVSFWGYCWLYGCCSRFCCFERSEI